MATDSEQSRHGQDPGPSYEKSDANSKWLFGIVGGLLLGVIAAEVVLSWVQTRLEKTPSPTNKWAGAAKGPNPLWTQVNAPRLQISSPEDLAKFRSREAAELNSYGWINRTAGVVHIPIERAMDLLLQRGLPVRAGLDHSRLGPTPLELQQQRTNSTAPETEYQR